MARLIATRPILYQNRIHSAGSPLPAADQKMVDTWLDTGSAVWEQEPESRAAEQEKRPAKKHRADGAAAG